MQKKFVQISLLDICRTGEEMAIWSFHFLNEYLNCYEIIESAFTPPFIGRLVGTVIIALNFHCVDDSQLIEFITALTGSICLHELIYRSTFVCPVDSQSA